MTVTTMMTDELVPLVFLVAFLGLEVVVVVSITDEREVGRDGGLQQHYQGFPA